MTNKTEYLKAKVTEAIRNNFLEQCERWGINQSDAFRDLAEMFIVQHSCPYKVELAIGADLNSISVHVNITGKHDTPMVFSLPKIDGWIIEPESRYNAHSYLGSGTSFIIDGKWSGVCKKSVNDKRLYVSHVEHVFKLLFHKIAMRMHELDGV